MNTAHAILRIYPISRDTLEQLQPYINEKSEGAPALRLHRLVRSIHPEQVKAYLEGDRDTMQAMSQAVKGDFPELKVMLEDVYAEAEAA